MNNRQNENLEELFGQFLSAEEADKAVKEYRAGEQILERYPAPVPSRKLIEDIKLQVEGTLVLQRSAIKRHTLYKYAAMAAMVVIAATISVKIFEKHTGVVPSGIFNQQASESFWGEEQDETDQPGTLATEIQNLESDINPLYTGGYGDIIQNETVELETQVIDTSSDFWRG